MSTQVVRFKRQAFVVGRPEVLPFLVVADALPWGIYASFRGTESELIAAGLATADMFQNLGKSGQRFRPDTYGNRTRVKRRQGDKWDLEIWASDGHRHVDPTKPSSRSCKWWREHGAAAESETAAILARFAKPAREARL